MGKGIKQLSDEIKRLSKENELLRKQVQEKRQFVDTSNSGNIDALVVAHKKSLKIYTEKTDDKIYRILIEKMHEGAIALTENGSILYANSYFAKMVFIDLQKVTGSTFVNFIDPSSRRNYTALIKKGRTKYAQREILLSTGKNTTITVLMSVNPLVLERNNILSIIITDLANKNRSESRSILIEKIITVIKEMDHHSNEVKSIKNSVYISNKLQHNYTYLANIFSEAKGISIQQYINIQKIEKVKQLLLYGNLSLTQISYQLNYCSLAHLSRQFKEITGLSATAYMRSRQADKR